MTASATGSQPDHHPQTASSDEDARMRLTFAVLREIGIIAQLSAAAFEKAMPGWSVAHFGVVQHLIRHGGSATPLDLARAFQQPKTTMTHTLQVLEKRGLIRFAPNPQDGRSKLAQLTQAGRAWHEAAMAQALRDQHALHERLPPGTLEALADHLPQLRAVMDAMRD